MSRNFTAVREMSEKKILSGKSAKNFPKNSINRLFSICHLVFYANYSYVFLLLNVVLVSDIYIHVIF